MVTASPTRRPISAAPTGETLEIRPSRALASAAPTTCRVEFLAVDLDPDAGAERHLRAALGGRNDDGDLELGLERPDPALEEPLFFARSVVLGVLLEVAVLPGGRDPPDHLGALHQQGVQLALEPLEALGRQVDGLGGAARRALGGIGGGGGDPSRAPAGSGPSSPFRLVAGPVRLGRRQVHDAAHLRRLGGLDLGQQRVGDPRCLPGT